MLRSQDVVVLVRLILTPGAIATPLAKLGASIGISAAEFHGALKRTSAAGLLDLEQRKPRVSQFLEFLEHGIRYVFISRPGEVTRGIPTAHSAPPLNELLMQGPLQRMFSNRGAAATAGSSPYSAPGSPGPIEKMFSNRAATTAGPGPYSVPGSPGPIEMMYSNRLGEDAAANPYALPTAIVWPHPEGEIRGESLEPLYPSVVDAARRDSALHESLALVDALRIGRARERKLAIDLLAKRFRAS